MKKKEAKQHSPVEAWVRYFVRTMKQNCKVEIKHVRDRVSLPFSDLEGHQLDDLTAFEEMSPFIHKFDDAGYRQKPCDIIGVVGGRSFIAIRYDKFIAIIALHVWNIEARKKERKSLTADRARAVAYDVIELSTSG